MIASTYVNPEMEGVVRRNPRDKPLRMVILSVEFPPGPGGIGTHAFELARQLHRRGWEISVVTPQDYASQQEIATFNRSLPFQVLQLRHFPGPVLEGVYRLAICINHLRRIRPHILLASGERAVWLAYVLSRIYGLPCVAVGHGSEFGVPSAFLQALMRSTYSRADAVVCVSDYTRTFMEARGIRAKRSIVILNGADHERFRVVEPSALGSVTKRLGLPASSRIILTVGNVTDRKGQEIVIRALPTVVNRVPGAHYLLVGLPTIESRLKALACELSVADHVHFLGRVDQDTLVQLLNLCDVFAMTSRRMPDGDFEGFGISVIEAALCGKPAVITAESGLLEAIDPGITGLAVAEGDVPAVADAIIKLLLDEPLRRQMGEAAQRRALQGQTWSHCVDHYERLLKSVLPARFAPAATSLPPALPPSST